MPTSVEPVKPITRTAGWSVIALPIARASPVTRLRTPGGRPARCASSPSASAVSGVSPAGFATTVQPTAIAGATLRVIIAAGKFHGVIAATTPIGCLITTMREFGAEGRIDLAVDALRLLAEELDEGGGVVDLAARLRERLPLFAGHDERDVVAIGDDEVEPAAQDLRALFRQCLRPRAEGALSRFDRADRLRFAKARSLGERPRRSRDW